MPAAASAKQLVAARHTPSYRRLASARRGESGGAWRRLISLRNGGRQHHASAAISEAAACNGGFGIVNLRGINDGISLGIAAALNASSAAS